MTHYVFLHGVPDTCAIWRPLISALNLTETQYTAPNLPGFGCPIPNTFTCTANAYLNWLEDVLTQTYDKYGPLHVLGHDWGGILIGKAVSLHPEKIQSWTLINAVLHPDYKWHKMAQLWQTPLIGEYVIWRMTGKHMAGMLRKDGVPPALAVEEGAAFNAHQKKAILRLYRSAKTLKKSWGKNVRPMPPCGLVLFGEDDPYIAARFGQDFARYHKATYQGLAGVGHWSLASNPDACADIIREHLALS